MYMSAPKDPFILLSWVNMKLRDNYPSLEEICASEGEAKEEISERLKAAGYSYDSAKNQFVILP